MGKRKIEEEIIKKEEFGSDDEAEEIRSKKPKEDEIRPLNPKHIKQEKPDVSTLPESSMKTERITFAEASAMIKKNPHCGFKIVKEKRHISLPYHLMSGKIKEALEYICRLQLNKYRGNVGGAVIAVDYKGIKLLSKSRVIDDQPCFHCQAITPFVVFSPAHQQNFEAIVTSINEGFITALIYGVITVNIDINPKRCKTAAKLEVGDVITALCECLQIKRGMCQMKGTFSKFVRKGTKNEIDSILISTQRNVNSSLSQQNKAIRLDDTDED